MCDNIFSGMSLASPADIGVVILQAVGSVSVFASPLAIRVGRILSLKNLREASWSSLRVSLVGTGGWTPKVSWNYMTLDLPCQRVEMVRTV